MKNFILVTLFLAVISTNLFADTHISDAEGIKTHGLNGASNQQDELSLCVSKRRELESRMDKVKSVVQENSHKMILLKRQIIYKDDEIAKVKNDFKIFREQVTKLMKDKNKKSN